MQATVNVRYDGSHFVAALTGTSKDPRDMNYAEWCDYNRRSSHSRKALKSEADVLADNLLIRAMDLGKKKESERVEYIVENLPDYFFPEEKKAAAQAAVGPRRLRATAARARRLRNKARLTAWNYFATFTYDGNKISEKDFEDKLRVELSRLAYENGWRYMGVWEKGSENGRLHLHVLLHVPDGKMKGTCEWKKHWSTKYHEWQDFNENSYFAGLFGLNDFKPIDPEELEHGTVIEYLLKYITKTARPLFFSRHVPESVTVTIDLEKDVICMEYGFYHWSLVLFDRIIEKIEMSGIKEQLELQRRWCFENAAQAVA